MRTRKKVLIVDNEVGLQYAWHGLLAEHGVEAVGATTEARAREILFGNDQVEPSMGHFDLVAMDGCLTGQHPDTIGLVLDIVEVGYTENDDRKLLAISSEGRWNEMLVLAGCTHKVENKRQVVPMILSLLGVSTDHPK